MDENNEMSGLQEKPPQNSQYETPLDPEIDNTAPKGILFGLGCLGASLLGCLGILLITGFVMVAGLIWLRANLISDKPLSFPPVYLEASKAKEFENKLKNFKNDLLTSKNEPVSLEITFEELNYQLQKSAKSNFEFYIIPAGPNTIEFLYSQKQEQSGQPAYINFSGKGSFKVHNEKADVSLNSIKIGKININNPDIVRYIANEVKTNLEQTIKYEGIPLKLEEFEIREKSLFLTVKVDKTVSTPSPAEIQETESVQETPEPVPYDD